MTTLPHAPDTCGSTVSAHLRRTRAQGRPVRVCFIIDELTTGGTETQLLALIQRLDRQRVQPFLCLLRGQEKTSQARVPDDCPVLHLGVGSLAHPATLAKAWRLLRFFRRNEIDVVQVYFPDSTYLGVPLAWLARVRRIVRTRNNLGYWMTPWHRRFARFCNYFTHVLVANCEATRQAVLTDEKLPAERAIVLENGVDLDRFPLKKSEGKTKWRRIGVVANLRPVKGLDSFVRAASILAAAHADTTFHIAGEGPLRRDLVRMAAERGIGHRFFMEGSVIDVPAFLDDLDVAVLPSRSEGMSNALLEYMAAGKVIVATAVGGNTRLIDDGVHGLLVPPNDPSALAEAIGRLLSNTELAARLGRAARMRAEADYSREAMVKRFEDFYLELMDAPTDRPIATPGNQR